MVWIVNRFTGGVNRSTTCGVLRTPTLWPLHICGGVACVAAMCSDLSC